MNLVRLFKSKDFIKDKIDTAQQRNQKVKILDNTYN